MVAGSGFPAAVVNMLHDILYIKKVVLRYILFHDGPFTCEYVFGLFGSHFGYGSHDVCLFLRSAGTVC